jgi:hypothetical protein
MCSECGYCDPPEVNENLPLIEDSESEFEPEIKNWQECAAKIIEEKPTKATDFAFLPTFDSYLEEFETNFNC